MRLVDGTYTEKIDNVGDIAKALVAGAAPMYPPDEWFENPGMEKLTPITVTADGRIYGHIADWSQDHMGLPPGTKPPHSNSDYAFFKTGALKTAGGNEVAIGNITLSGGHAPLNASAGEAVEHYDNTASAVADVNVGEDAHGIWISGGLRPGVDESDIRALRASAPSGDWRPINGNLELVAVCQVNTPGFPIARTLVASGETQALVAAGASHLYQLQQERSTLSSLGVLEQRVESLESLVAAKAAPKERFGDAPKSDNSTDDNGDDSADDQNDQNGDDDNAGTPSDDHSPDSKDDSLDVSNDGELKSNQGKNPPRKPKLPSKKKPLNPRGDVGGVKGPLTAAFKKKADEVDSDNDGDTDATEGDDNDADDVDKKKKKPLFSPKAEAPKKALTAAKVVRTEAGAKRWGVPIGTVLNGKGKPVGNGGGKKPAARIGDNPLHDSMRAMRDNANAAESRAAARTSARQAKASAKKVPVKAPTKAALITNASNSAHGMKAGSREEIINKLKNLGFRRHQHPDGSSTHVLTDSKDRIVRSAKINKHDDGSHSVEMRYHDHDPKKLKINEVTKTTLPAKSSTQNLRDYADPKKRAAMKAEAIKAGRLRS